MLGKKRRPGRELFYIAGSIEDLIPEDYVLKKVNTVLDLGWLRKEVRGLYCENNGRPGIDPECAVRLMLAGFMLGIVHDRELMREAQIHLGIRWFAGYSLEEILPDHSSLTRIRQRWGEEKFKMIFERTVMQCVKAGLVKGDLVHVDATLIRADVSWESLVERHVEKVASENGDDGGDDGPEGKTKKVSETDPDATMATSRKDYRLEPTYKQHTAVDDEKGVIVDVEVTTGEKNEGKKLPEQVERVEAQTGKKVATLTADGGYGHSGNYAYLEARGTDAVIPPQTRGGRRKGVPSTRFKYDASVKDKSKHKIPPAPQSRRFCRVHHRRLPAEHVSGGLVCTFDATPSTAATPNAACGLPWLDFCLISRASPLWCDHASVGAGVPACAASIAAGRPLPGPTQEILEPSSAGGSINKWASQAIASTELGRRFDLGMTAGRSTKRCAAAEAVEHAEAARTPTGSGIVPPAHLPSHRRTPCLLSRRPGLS